MSATLTLLLIGLLTGCRTLSQGATSTVSVENAQRYLRAGEIFQARQMAEQILYREPGNLEAERLMAQVLEQEISRQQEIFESTPVEEMTREERSAEARSWVERAQALYELGQQEQALTAAEKVFIYQPTNLEASHLVDSIKQSIHEGGRDETQILKRAYESQIQDRIAVYKRQANLWVSEEKWGAARLAVEKVLLLSPEDTEAKELYEDIQSYGERSQRET
ncbi:MAG: hypothetical protein Q8R76_04235 [Candidatus Omnitrophota bacterium]|nr:hypothetical protein [Candidatus Omnitrophota bacterium]